MIFNTWDYYLLFLFPAAILFRISRRSLRPWIIVFSGCLFFLYFSYTQLGGAIGAACLLIFLWESFISRFYKPNSWFCYLGVVQTILFLVGSSSRFSLGAVLASAKPESTLLAKRFLTFGNFLLHLRISSLRLGSLPQQDRNWLDR